MTANTAMVRRILRHYRAATPAVHAAGQSWYRAAQDAAAAIYPERPDIAAGVIAALSPRAQWSVNVRWARAIVHAARTGAPMPAVHTETMRTIAWRIATGEQTPEQALKGPKTSRFYRNIMQDMDCATVDIWAMRAALGPSMPAGKQAPTRVEYRAIESAYIRAARIAGTSPAMLQAVVWIQVRGAAA